MSIMDHLTSHTHPDVYGPYYTHHLVEQYKLYVEMAERISQRRASANAFFVSANSMVLTACGALVAFDSLRVSWGWTLLAALAGAFLSGFWWWQVRSYRLLNSAKYRVIGEIEEMLPIRPYKAEWAAVGFGKDWRRYLPVTHIEQWIPIAFGTIYVGLAVMSAFPYISR